MEIFFQSETWLSLVMLTAMEIVLGIDNIVFLSILAAQLPPGQQKLVRGIGLSLALVGRLLLLLLVSWMMHLTRPLLTVLGRAITGRDLILIGGGLFLVAKATKEIGRRTEHGAESKESPTDGTFFWALAQVLALDLVFSLDSVITAVGMAKDFRIMAAAVVIAVVVMLVSARSISEFINRHPSMRVLALAFLLLIGVMLMADGMGHHIPKGYIYFAMAFSLLVEVINLRKGLRSSHTGSS